MKTYGPANRDTNYCQFNYALALLAAGETAAAREQAQSAFDIRFSLLPAGHPQLADAWEMIGTIDLALGNHRLAIEEFTKAIDLRAKFYGSEHVLVANAQTLLAEALATQGEPELARVQAASALARQRANQPADLSQLGLAEATLGRAELAQ